MVTSLHRIKGKFGEYTEDMLDTDNMNFAVDSYNQTVNRTTLHTPILMEKYPQLGEYKRFFKYLAEFVRYEDGNALVYILNPDLSRDIKPILIPIYFTKYITKNDQKILKELDNILRKKLMI
jgi:hypothetical protein